MGVSHESVIAGGVVGGVVAGTAVSSYMALTEAAPYHEQGRELLVGTCDNPLVQSGVAAAVEDVVAGKANFDPASIPGVTVGADGAVDVVSSPETCVAAIEHVGTNGVASSARRAALEVIVQANPELAAKINELSGYISPWAVPATVGALAILGGTAWVFKQLFIPSRLA